MAMRLAVAVIASVLLGSAAAAQPPPMEALPQILALQLDQHPAWRAYKDAVAEERAYGVAEAGEAEQINAMATPARLDALQDQLRRRDAAFARQAEATRTFYAVLSPQQKQVFDQVTRLPPPRPPQRSAMGSRSSFRVPIDPQGQPVLPPPQ